MKKDQILWSIKTGVSVSVIDHMKFKRGKLIKGTYRKHYCGDKTITELQFYSIKHLLGPNTTGELNRRVYFYKEQNNQP